MGTIEFKVNGVKVSEIYFRNYGLEDPSDYSSNTYMYYYEHYTQGQTLEAGYVAHDRGNGILSLAALIIDNLEVNHDKSSGNEAR